MLSFRRILRSAEGLQAHAAFTDRHGGFSGGAYDSFNLGGRVGDDPSAVSMNRAELASVLGLGTDDLVFMEQVHGRDVAVVDHADDEIRAVDALVTTRKSLALVVLVADCTPVLLADVDAGLIGVAHAGRPGMLAGVVGNVVATMRGAGARHIQTIVGPSICPRHYEVEARMRDEAARIEPVSRSVSMTGTPAIDVASSVVEQLRRNDASIEWLEGCTYSCSDLYSYRRDGATGRFAGVLWLSDTASGDE